MNQFQFRRLVKNEICCSQQLLYRVYHQELKWKPPKNPSGIVFENNKLCDQFDFKSSWIGAFLGKYLIGCLRFYNGPFFEAELYYDLDEIFNILPRQQTVEITRLAVHQNYRGLGIMKYLFKYTKYICQDKSIFGTSSSKSVAKSLIGSGFVDSNISFKYLDLEPEVSVYYHLSEHVVSSEQATSTGPR